MTGKKSSTAAILRCWNNPHVVNQVKNLLTIGVGLIIVVVNSEKEEDLATRAWLEEENLLQDSRVRIIEMHKGFSWCNGLNIALKMIAMMNVSDQVNKQFRFILPISVEAKIKEHHFEAMLDAITDAPNIAVVGTSFRGLQNGNEVELGRGYRHGRNTCSLYNLELLGNAFPTFDGYCDQVGGMEDIDWLINVVALSGYEFRYLDLKIDLIVGVHWNQKLKHEREHSAMEAIFDRWLDLFPENTPEGEKITQIVEEFKLR